MGEESVAWVALKMVRGVGNRTAQSLICQFGGPCAVFAASSSALARAGLRSGVAAALRDFDRWAEAETQLLRLRDAGGRLLVLTDANYPTLLRQIYDPPICLFVLGPLGAGDAAGVAVVGSRSPSRYGIRMAEELSYALAGYGLNVVSGLARGVDAAAHGGALAAGGRTIAVVGNGIDVIYPSEHHRLRMQVAKNGAVVSEFPMGARPEPQNFPVRNRVISGLTLGTVVVEATERSGSLITARCALEQDREVFAVPGPVRAQSRGPHRLLREGAVLVESAEDVVREIAPRLLAVPAPAQAEEAAIRPTLRSAARQVLGCLGEGTSHIDELTRRSGLSTAEVLQILLELELGGLIRQLPGKCFELGPSRSGGQNRNDFE